MKTSFKIILLLSLLSPNFLQTEARNKGRQSHYSKTWYFSIDGCGGHIHLMISKKFLNHAHTTACLCQRQSYANCEPTFD